MSDDHLLRLVLPIDSAPDFRDKRRWSAPEHKEYAKKRYEENVKDYKLYHMIRAQIFLHDEIDSLSPDAVLDQVILGLLYHPRFPDTFFNYIANSVNGLPILPSEEVEAFLEGNYGQNIQQPDCEYLSTILTLWSGSYTVLFFSKVETALGWIERKHRQLPSWPLSSSKGVNNSEVSINKGKILNSAPENIINNDSPLITDERILFVSPNFKWRETDQAAQDLHIISNGRFMKSAREQGILLGFIDALKECNIVHKHLTLKDLKIVFGKRYIIALTAEEYSNRRIKYCALTKDYLNKHFFNTK